MRDDGSAKLTEAGSQSDSKRKRNGRAKIIQDIAAPPGLCMHKILDYDNYTKMVSLLKKYDIYNTSRLNNVSTLPL